ncbi:unnamed protein product [Gulo gulo]|uniref:Uncharacterized protein n=1 Tax=Gulo gulo TaxID=48420 RepID=A0A9X9MBF0_GULGU|nr:unnamed protein product [Gulo gulo]
MKLSPKPSRLEAWMLAKMLGPSRVLLPGFGCEFTVLLQRREPSCEGKVAGFITRRHRDKKRARRGSPRRKQFGSTRVLSLETIKALERENVLSGAFPLHRRDEQPGRSHAVPGNSYPKRCDFCV